MPAYYNEHDPLCVEWLRNLIAAGMIAPGDVDGRDIQDVKPDDLKGYAQAHFFAGIGVWSAALRDAGWPDDREIWTGSCPCQPFSAAGQGGGFDDERHLWPAFHHLIAQRKPAAVAGEQVASPAGLLWLDLVSADLEGTGYAFGAVDLCAAGIAVAAGETGLGRETLEWISGAVLTCPDPRLAAELRDYAEWFGREIGVGAPHVRQRLYWLADRSTSRRGALQRPSQTHGRPQIKFDGYRDAGAMADADGGHAGAERQQRSWQQRQQPQDGSACELGVAKSERPKGEPSSGRQTRLAVAAHHGDLGNARGAGLALGSLAKDGRRIVRHEGTTAASAGSQGWSDSDWIVCTDGKARPVEPGTFPLAHGAIARVGRLRAYGNALVRAQAAEFIRAAQEAINA